MFSRLPRLLSAKRRPALRWLVLAGLCVGLLGWWIVASGPRITISRETTYLTGPLDEEGFVDYARALNELSSEGVTAEQNALPLLFQAWGPPNREPEVNQKYFELIGTAVPPPEPYSIVKSGDQVRVVRADDSPYFIGFHAFLERKGFLFERFPHGHGLLDESADGEDGEWAAWDKVLSTVTREPWGAADHPAAAAWLDANARPLELLVQASSKPRMFSPLISNGSFWNELNPQSEAFESMSRALAARAMLALGERNWHAAASDLETLHRLAALAAQGASSSAGLQLSQKAFQLDRHLASLAPEDVRAGYRRVVEAMPSFPDPGQQIDTVERLATLSMVCGAARAGTTRIGYLAAVSGQVPKTPVSLIDWNYALSQVNAWYDRAEAAFRQPTRSTRRSALDSVLTEIELFEQHASQGRALRHWLRPRRELGERVAQQWVYLYAAGWANLLHQFDRADTERELTRLVFALHGHRDDQGRFPERLDELVPRYLTAVPLDPFSDSPFHYRAEKAGQGFVLYSVGWNEQDDSGREREGNSKEDDIVVRYPTDLEAPATDGE